MAGYEHEKGHAFGAAAIAQAIAGADFPLSKQDLIKTYGDKEIEYTKGNPQKFKDLLYDLPSETYNSPADLEHAIHEMMS